MEKKTLLLIYLLKVKPRKSIFLMAVPLRPYSPPLELNDHWNFFYVNKVWNIFFPFSLIASPLHPPPPVLMARPLQKKTFYAAFLTQQFI